jgi:hypothetical protein
MEPTIAETPVYKFLRQIVNDLNNENYKLKLNDIKQVWEGATCSAASARGRGGAGDRGFSDVLVDSFRLHIPPISIHMHRCMSSTLEDMTLRLVSFLMPLPLHEERGR